MWTGTTDRPYDKMAALRCFPVAARGIAIYQTLLNRLQHKKGLQQTVQSVYQMFLN